MKTSSVKHRVLLVVLGALALLASACGVTRGDSAPAATVHLPNGETVEISNSELDEISTSISASERFVESAFSGALPPGFDAQLLTTLVIEKVIDSILVEEGVTVEQGVIDEAVNGLTADVNGLFQDETVTAEVVVELAPYLDSLGRIRAKQASLGDALLAAQPEPEMVSVPCTRHILVETLAEADDLAAQIEGGSDFGELATEFSLDPGSGAQGGLLGCVDPVGFVEPFRDAIIVGEQGEILGPVETQFGFHLIVIDGYEDVTTGTIDPAQLASERISEALSVMPDVEVNPSIGFWDAGRLIVAPVVENQPNQ